MKIFVAGQARTVRTEEIEKYLRKHRRTIREFDLRTGVFPLIDEDLIKATRVFRSRISNSELTWFKSIGETAPWGNVKPEDRLVQADPFESNGLYRRALSLWSHFADSAKPGVADAKISKVLHAMRPHFFPVLDSQIRKKYRSFARECAIDLSLEPVARYAYWAAIRNDIMMSSEGLKVLRQDLKSSGADGSLIDWAEKVSDVRLHDVVAWSTEPEPTVP